MSHKKVVGRFAPSPTGPLHQGSLTAAVASFLFARSVGGDWLLRIEDVDQLRAVPGADRQIMDALRAHGMHWDGPVIYQSQRIAAYRAALQKLMQKGLVYTCDCSRKQIAERSAGVYDGHCRSRLAHELTAGKALRINFTGAEDRFYDGVLGLSQFNSAADRADFVVVRRDGFFAYQLAVVVDDAFSGVNQVVRGMDIIDSTPRQRFLNRLLGYSQPHYYHIPLVTDDEGRKLSKSDADPPLNRASCCRNLLKALEFLGQHLPPPGQQRKVENILDFAVENFEPERIPNAVR